jgi:hypothetical protein
MPGPGEAVKGEAGRHHRRSERIEVDAADEFQEEGAHAPPQLLNRDIGKGSQLTRQPQETTIS